MPLVPLISLDGLVHRGSLTSDRLLDVGVVDHDGRIVVSLVDLFAMMRLDRSAEILLVEFVDGSSIALAVRDALRSDEIMLHLDVRADPPRLIPRLWSGNARSVLPQTAVREFRAMTFATFVGIVP